jgi:hypothetical protein
VGQDFWDGLTALLSEHFPYDAVSDVNELSDEIDFSRSRKK